MLAIVLPAVLYPAAINTLWRDFRQSLRPILLLAIGLVATTTLAVGIAFKWLVPEAPWAVAFALGAIVSPPDAVAATAVLRRFRLPRRIVTLLEGESLVNDATGLVLFRFAVATALTGAFSGWEMVGQFGLIAVGGILLGIAIGWITAKLQERLHDPMLELALSLTTPFATYWLCEWLQVSGVLGVVAVGLYRSQWSHRGSSAFARLNIRTFWGAVVFVVNCLVFVLIGIQLPVIAESLLEHQSLSWPRIVGLIAALSLVAIGVRFLWILTATYGVRLLLPSVRRPRSRVRPGFDPGELERHAGGRFPGCSAGLAGRIAERRSVSAARPRNPARIRHRVRDAGRPGTDSAGPGQGAAAGEGHFWRH